MVRMFFDGKLECEHESEDIEDDIVVNVVSIGGPED